MAQSFSDDFNRANSTGLGAAWTAMDGRFDVSSNQAVSTVGGAGSVTSAGYGTLTDTDDNYSEIQPVSTSAIGAHARGLGSATAEANLTSYVGTIIVAGGTLRLFKLVSGTFTQLGSDAAYTWASGDKIRTTANGSAITLSLNGTNKVAVTDTAITTGKRVLVRTGATSRTVDNWLGGDVVATAARSLVCENRLVRRNSLLRR